MKHKIKMFCLQSHREQADLAHTVDVMVDLGLTYAQTKNPDGTYQYQIDPDINFLCNFRGICIHIKLIIVIAFKVIAVLN